MASHDADKLPAPMPQKLLAAPEPPLLLAAPESRWKRHAKPITAGLVAGFLIIAFAIGWFLHHRRASAAEDANDEAASTTRLVTVVAVKRSASLSELLLPGSLSPIAEASLYARASGYVKKRYVDIGDTVKKGQVLAEIESPELDQQVEQGRAAAAQARQQVNQARASVGDAQARVDLGRVTVQRYELLLQQDSIARQDVDVQRQIYESALASLGSAKANVGAAEENERAAAANVRRLVALQQFERVRAPFDGVITARNIDEGALISSNGAGLGGSSSTALMSLGSSTGSGSTAGGGSTSTGADGGSSGGGSSSQGGSGGNGIELFRIAQVDRLRVYVSVPQDNAGAIQLGAEAAVFIQQYADRFAGRVARTARALDTTSRTLLTEVQIPNESQLLMPGMYAQVRFSSQRSNPPLLVPGETLIARSQGTKVAVLGPLNDDDKQKLQDPNDARCARKVHLQEVVVGRDYGTEVEVARGLRGGEFLILSPGDTAQEGAVMLPRLHDESEGGGGPGGGQKSGSSGAGGASGPGGGGKGQAASGGQGGKGGDKKQGDSKDSKKDAKGQADADKEERRQAQSTCIEDQARASAALQKPEPPAPAGLHPETGPASQPKPGAAAAGRAPLGAASEATAGGPSERSPPGIQSPSMQAPTQGAKR